MYVYTVNKIIYEYELLEEPEQSTYHIVALMKAFQMDTIIAVFIC